MGNSHSSSASTTNSTTANVNGNSLIGAGNSSLKCDNNNRV